MGSLIEELRRREAAARAEADRLRARIEELAGDLARAEEQVTRSRTSSLTRRQVNAFTPSGCAKCTSAPAAARVSAAQYHPYVASSTTLGFLPARAISARSATALLVTRAVPSRLPSSLIRQHAAPPVQIHPDNLPAVVVF